MLIKIILIYFLRHYTIPFSKIDFEYLYFLSRFFFYVIRPPKKFRILYENIVIHNLTSKNIRDFSINASINYTKFFRICYILATFEKLQFLTEENYFYKFIILSIREGKI